MSETTPIPARRTLFRMTMTARQRFSVTCDLLYPAALGAALAWWVEALVHWHSDANGPAATVWMLWFGAFFILYHSRSFVIARDEESEREKRRRNSSAMTEAEVKADEYSPPQFTKDVIDCIALLLACFALRFPDGKPELINPAGAFTVAALIPLGALFTSAKLERSAVPRSWILRVTAFVAAVAGAIHARAELRGPFDPSAWDRGALWVLLGLLAAYLLWPHVFGARTPEQRSNPTTNDFSAVESTIRIILASTALILAFVFVWYGIRAEAAGTSTTGETREIERWVIAGMVRNFDPGQPCVAKPDIANQVPTVISSLLSMHASKVQVIGVADITRLTPRTRDFLGNNAGLAKMRSECILRWLRESRDLVGVEFVTAVDLPRNVRSADPTDRAVVVMALTSSSTVKR